MYYFKFFFFFFIPLPVGVKLYYGKTRPYDIKKRGKSESDHGSSLNKIKALRKLSCANLGRFPLAPLKILHR